jgi:hypothetical protein
MEGRIRAPYLAARLDSIRKTKGISKQQSKTAGEEGVRKNKAYGQALGKNVGHGRIVKNLITSFPEVLYEKGFSSVPVRSYPYMRPFQYFLWK